MSAGVSTHAEVVFTPQVNADIVTVLPLLAETGPINIPLECYCRKAIVKPDKTTLDFGSVIYGEEGKVKLVLQNSGALPVRFELLSRDGKKLPLTKPVKLAPAQLADNLLKQQEAEVAAAAAAAATHKRGGGEGQARTMTTTKGEAEAAGGEVKPTEAKKVEEASEAAGKGGETGSAEEESKKEEVKKEEAKKGDTKKEGAKKAETKKEEAKKADAKKADSKKVDSKKAEDKKEEAPESVAAPSPRPAEAPDAVPSPRPAEVPGMEFLQQIEFPRSGVRRSLRW